MYIPPTFQSFLYAYDVSVKYYIRPVQRSNTNLSTCSLYGLIFFDSNCQVVLFWRSTSPGIVFRARVANIQAFAAHVSGQIGQGEEWEQVRYLSQGKQKCYYGRPSTSSTRIDSTQSSNKHLGCFVQIHKLCFNLFAIPTHDLYRSEPSGDTS